MQEDNRGRPFAAPCDRGQTRNAGRPRHRARGHQDRCENGQSPPPLHGPRSASPGEWVAPSRQAWPAMPLLSLLRSGAAGWSSSDRSAWPRACTNACMSGRCAFQARYQDQASRPSATKSCSEQTSGSGCQRPWTSQNRGQFPCPPPRQGYAAETDPLRNTKALDCS